MKFHNVLDPFCRYLVIASLSFGILRAEERNLWEIKEIDGAKYVAVEQIQKFYRFEKSTRNESSISLENSMVSMNLKIGSRECRLNNLKIILSKPVAETGNVAYVSSSDLAGLLDPMLRPNQIAGAADFRAVILDPAHGGKDPGFTNELGKESEFTLKIANLTKKQLEARGFKVVLTRNEDEDASPEERLNLANKVEGTAIFVSISFNSGPATKNGIQTSAVARGEDVIGSDPFGSVSVALSTAIHGAIIGRLGNNTSDGGIKKGELGVFSRVKHPAVLVKPGFMTNPTESRLIANVSYQAAVAKAIVEGVCRYRFAVSRIPKVKSEDAHDPK
jgi:N-acetylmuramoyl-L-alanine amidase